MFKVVSKIKEGNKVSYICKDEATLTEYKFDKDKLIDEINKNNVINARIQNYKGQLIISLKEDKDTNIERQPRKQKQTKQKQIYAIDLYKSIMKDFGIRQEELALAVGFDYYDLEEDITNSGTYYIEELSYRMASDIKKIADMQNNQILMNYRSKYLERK